MNPNVEFYEKMKELQDIQHTSEEKRVQLEQQLNTYIRSDKRLAKLKAVRLQSYWKKICEDERKSQWRNEQLQRDFERVEAHMEDLQTRTEKLRTMKKRFEDHIESAYPNWKEKIMYYQRLRESQEVLDRNRQAEELRRATMSAVNAQNTMQELFNQPQHNQLSRNIMSGSVQNQKVTPTQADMRYHQESQASTRHSQYQPQEKIDYESKPVSTGIYEGGSTIPTLSSLPTGTGISTGFSGNSIQATSTPHPGHHVDVRQQLQYSKIEHDTARQLQYDRIDEESNLSQNIKSGHSKSPRQYEASPRQVSSSSTRHQSHSPREQITQKQHHQSTTSDTRDTTQTPTTQITQHQVNSFMEPAELENEVYSYRSNPKTPSPRIPHDQGVLDQTDEFADNTDSDFGSVEELPTSRSESPKRSAKTPEPQVQQSLDSSRSIYASAELTLSGLYAILSAIAEHMNSPVAKNLYKGDRPAESVQAEIIGNANRGTALNYMDSISLSMVVLDQLPLLTASTQEKCILPDSILFKFPPVISESSISKAVPPTSRFVWEKLLEHFVILAKHKIMKTQEISEVFAQHIIASDSPYEHQATELICNLLDDMVPADLASPNSTSTFSATPRRIPQVLQKRHSSDEEDEDDFFSKVPPKEVNAVPLTQSAAYRQMLGSTVSTQKSVSYIDSEDDEDDIEKQIVSPRPGSLKKPEPVSGASSPKIPASPSREGALSPASLGSGMSSPAPKSPLIASGYVPSALVDTGRSIPGQSTISSMGSTGKKPAFMYGGDSDTDEDIDLPGNKQKNDDFDFYD